MTDFVAYDDFGRGMNMNPSTQSGWWVGVHPTNGAGISVLTYADDHWLEFAIYGNPDFDSMSATYSLTNSGVILHSFEYASGEWLTTQMLNMEIGLSDDDLLAFAGGASLILPLTLGNDTFDLNNYDDLVYAGPGDDVIASYGGNDTLYGGDGSDYIDGGAGSDWLFGGPGGDAFAFYKGSGNDVIMDPESGDVLLMDTALADSYRDLKKVAYKSHGDLVLKFGHGDMLRIEDTKLKELKGSVDWVDFYG